LPVLTDIRKVAQQMGRSVTQIIVQQYQYGYLSPVILSNFYLNATT